MAGQMQETVDAIKRKFGGDIVTKLGRPRSGYGCTDKDLSVWECDDVRRAPKIKKFTVDPRHGAISDDHAFHLLQLVERSAQLAGDIHAQRKG